MFDDENTVVDGGLKKTATVRLLLLSRAGCYAAKPALQGVFIKQKGAAVRFGTHARPRNGAKKGLTVGIGNKRGGKLGAGATRVVFEESAFCCIFCGSNETFDERYCSAGGDERGQIVCCHVILLHWTNKGIACLRAGNPLQHAESLNTTKHY